MKPWEIDADLSVGRARLTKAARTTWTWLPLHHWTLDDVLTYVDAQGITLHPTYDFLTRFSCRVCIFATAKDLVAIRQNDPEAFYRILALEKQIAFTMRQDGNVEEVADRYLERAANGDLTIRSRKPAPAYQQLCMY
jgi:3'-phosphoadenosine 5'-phosphosulfate sulfotransferase (PAPS reductase)/FAD synthetase